jgi:hypothetical protein
LLLTDNNKGEHYLHAWGRAAEVEPVVPVAEDCVKLGIPVMALFSCRGWGAETPDGRKLFNGRLGASRRAGAQERISDLGVTMWR